MDTVAGFSDSYEISSTILSAGPTDNTTESSVARPSAELPVVDVSALQLLSNNLESLFDSPESSYSDAKLILADDRELSFNRCILAARSPFFKTALAATAAAAATKKIELKKIATEYEVGFDSVAAVMAYVYTGRVRPPPKGVSNCADEDCCHVSCRPAVDFMVEVLYLSFVFQIPELVTMYQRHLMDVVDKVIIEDTLIILKLASICGQEKLFDKCTEIIVKSNLDLVTLNKSLPQGIVEQVIDIRKELGLVEVPEPDKHVSNIHKALESHDLALVDMLLKEGRTSLDDACALHFAVAYCAVETATELLKLGLADVNRRNQRGYTVLHVAAMRKEPSLIALLLTKGANASEMGLDGRTALLIAKQVTKAAEYNCVLERGKDSPKGRLCVEILEQPERLDPLPADVSPSLALVADNELKIRLIDFENRVQMARCFFPKEAQLAMSIAETKGTSEFTVDSQEPDGTGAKRSAPDQYMAPFVFQEKHRSRLEALSKTVEYGRRFFPRCAALLDKIADCETLTILAFLEKDTPENRLVKRQKYMEIQESLQMAFNEDNEEQLGKSSRSGSSSSTSKSTKRSKGKPSHRRRP